MREVIGGGAGHLQMLFRRYGAFPLQPVARMSDLSAEAQRAKAEATCVAAVGSICPGYRRVHPGYALVVIASEAKQSRIPPR